MYPTGATPAGLLDMSGNVWEWTRTRYRPYPYRPADGRNEPEAEGMPVVRGGSWDNFPRNARCAVRNRNVPDDFNNNRRSGGCVPGGFWFLIPPNEFGV
ncbi:MAG: SUMF1/EgtB/PvdO family nonheme iron enzyme [Anaerolineae bacterium]|nr:SUMF1/EgtB/PvdO family nonheme iron enzyme [Anaerolineae bacterium]